MLTAFTLYVAGLVGLVIGYCLGATCRKSQHADLHMRGWQQGWLSRAAFEKSTEGMIAEAELRNAGFTRECDP